MYGVRIDLTHEQWLARLTPDTPSWGMNWLYRAAFVVSATEGIGLVTFSLLIWGPALWFGIERLRSGELAALWWFAAFAHAFLAANPGIGLLGTVAYCFFIGLGISLGVGHGAYHYAAGVIPLWHYIAGSALKGTTMVGLEQRLRDDPAAFERLKQRGLIFFVDDYDPPPAAP